MATTITIQYSTAGRTMFVCLTYTGEEQRSQSSIHNVQNPVTDEDAEDSEEDQDNQTDEKHTVAGSEVILGLWEQDIKVSEYDRCT